MEHFLYPLSMPMCVHTVAHIAPTVIQNRHYKDLTPGASVLSQNDKGDRNLYIAIIQGPGDWLSFIESWQSFGQAMQTLFQ